MSARLAALVLLLCAPACGDDDGAGVVPDATVDAPDPPDAPPPPPDAAPPDVVLTNAPDLVLMGEMMTSSVEFDTISVDPESCEVDEMCVTGLGTRTILRFDTVSYNQGDADLLVGTPDPGSPLWEWSDCHGHAHFLGFAVYELLSAEGVIATGRKQAFCLLDLMPITAPPNSGKFTCSYQGITAGWADIYSSDLPCQWIDVTDVPPGTYTLRVSLNPERNLFERDYTNNIFELPVTIE